MRRTKLLLWRSGTSIWRPGQTTFLTECPRGHERTITVDQRTPERDWTLTCPLCGGEHRVVAPEILRSDL